MCSLCIPSLRYTVWYTATLNIFQSVQHIRSLFRIRNIPRTVSRQKKVRSIPRRDPLVSTLPGKGLKRRTCLSKGKAFIGLYPYYQYSVDATSHYGSCPRKFKVNIKFSSALQNFGAVLEKNVKPPKNLGHNLTPFTQGATL